MTTAEVKMWGTSIGAVHWDDDRSLGLFEFQRGFLASGIQVSPLHMPLAEVIYSFPALGRDCFHGLPGMLADVLPDRFGNALINAWLASQGRTPDSFNPVERLCYSGARGMGALEFSPAIDARSQRSNPLDVSALVDLASRVLSDRNALSGSLLSGEEGETVRDILRVGTSAGGARAKAVIAWNPLSGEIRSGDADHQKGFEHWLMKFDGVRNNRDRELTDSMGFGRIEYAYSLMAAAAGVNMMPCRLLQENGRSHFMTKRFDRSVDGGKLHMQSLSGLAHFDFNMAGAYSYEQALMVMRQLDLSMDQREQQFRRAILNLVARNQDDHVKNIAFLMDKAGRWSLSPAFDVTYSYNPDGDWTSRHQMSLNQKRDDFEREDLRACAEAGSLRRNAWMETLDEVLAAVRDWPKFAEQAGVDEKSMAAIAATHRLNWPG
jgi:serine/threonine-protein kinase HipA